MLMDGWLITVTGRSRSDDSQAALYRKYLDQGIGLDELVVLGIGPELPAKIEVDELLDF